MRMNFGVIVNEINRVGTRVERNIDDIWFPAIVMSVSQVESISAVVTVQYLDDDRIEYNIPLNQLRLFNRTLETNIRPKSQPCTRNKFETTMDGEGKQDEEEQEEYKQPEIVFHRASNNNNNNNNKGVSLSSSAAAAASSSDSKDDYQPILSRHIESKDQRYTSNINNTEISTTDGVNRRGSIDGSTSAKNQNRYAAGGALKALRYLKHNGEEEDIDDGYETENKTRRD